MEEFYTACIKERANNGTTKKTAKQYKLGEVIANGVRFFGVVPSRGKRTVIKAVCPICGELWEVDLYNVQSGNSQSCCMSGIKR
jgi:hypothetical protein